MYAHFTFTEWRGAKKYAKIYLSVMCSRYTRGVLLEKARCCGPPRRIFPWWLFWRKICITYRGWEANQCRVTTPPYMKRHIWRMKQTVNKHWLDLKCFSHQKRFFFFKLWMGGFGQMWYCRISSYWPQHSSSRTRSVSAKTTVSLLDHMRRKWGPNKTLNLIQLFGLISTKMVSLPSVGCCVKHKNHLSLNKWPK